ncbi:MAG: YhbY family RNA-binding protein [Syntrophales bacterium]|nr:YhbY family RNA-binding protein [Syntrophales bacterium]MDD5232054.1 YhbY family RNA-binding protein [Syntrophales bacterium]MDD5532517.1 YhbY family RNA-binding protein [Syntrophales bacterium]
MMALKGYQRKYLRAQAHSLRSLVQVGKKGVSSEVVSALDQALRDHELVKVRFLEHKEEKKILSGELSKLTGSEAVGSVGHIVIFYRENPVPEKRRYRVPMEGRKA